MYAQKILKCQTPYSHSKIPEHLEQQTSRSEFFSTNCGRRLNKRTESWVNQKVRKRIVVCRSQPRTLFGGQWRGSLIFFEHTFCKEQHPPNCLLELRPSDYSKKKKPVNNERNWLRHHTQSGFHKERQVCKSFSSPLRLLASRAYSHKTNRLFNLRNLVRTFYDMPGLPDTLASK